MTHSLPAPVSKRTHPSTGTNHTSSRTIHCIVAVMLVISLAGCGEEQTEDLHDFVADVKMRKKSNIAPLPTPQRFETFTYNDGKLRDPFQPTAVIEVASIDHSSGLRPDTGRPKDVLEQFAVGSIRMMGVLEKKGQIWALIRTSDGTLYRTQKGRHLGQNHGEIIKITENELELREIIPDGLGGWTERFTTLAVNE
ncbi:MAG: pilus assembly protein PilP [Gammaproteobacteria bacterium]|nr:pilus assembly protein PilP [Gammaproteobacteria bacterium]